LKLTKQNTGRLNLAPGKTDAIYWDDNLKGFGLRLRAGGSRVWIAQYRTDTGQRREKIGSADKIDADAARKAAKQILARVTAGHDPAAEKRERQMKNAETFGAHLVRYLKRQKERLRPRSYREVERHLRIYAKRLHVLPLIKIERRTIAALLGELADRAGAATADCCRASLSAFFVWLTREGILETSPVIHTNRHYDYEPRNRVLTGDELRAVWKALPTDPGDYAAIVRLLMLTGQRREEIGGLMWSEVDFDRAVIRLPGERTKNHREHEVPLSAPALAILSSVPRREGRDHIFGYGQGAFGGWTCCKARLDDKAKIAPWVLHDLRRTVVTKMAEELSILPHVIEAIINHVSGHKAGVAGVYNKAVYAAEKRQALDRWADHLVAIVEGRATNVTPLRRA
jgi:integrase